MSLVLTNGTKLKNVPWKIKIHHISGPLFENKRKIRNLEAFFKDVSDHSFMNIKS